MVEPLIIRCATESDAPSLLSIYRPFVESTAVSFEPVTPTVDEFAARIRKSLATWQWLVAERDGRCVGYAYGTSHRERAAYRWSAEVSAYVHADYHRRGIGRALYERLFADPESRGFCNAFAGITQPNDASVRLHLGVGFELIGTFRSVGRKLGKWHDVSWYQRALRDAPQQETPDGGPR